MYDTCAYAHARGTHTHTLTHTYPHAQMPHMRHPPSLTCPLSLCYCQIKGWRAGHKGDCVPAARAGARTAATPTADQMRVLNIPEQLVGADDWRGVAAQERAAKTVAAVVRTSMLRYAAWVYGTLARAYDLLGH
jgi:hypothetical protein